MTSILRLTMLAFTVLTVSCMSEPRAENLPPATYQLATEAQIDQMQLTASEARKAFLLVQWIYAPGKQTFEGVPNVFVMRIGEPSYVTGYVSYHVCLSKSTPSVEIGEGGGWSRISRYKWATGVTCLGVKKGGYQGEGSDKWKAESGPSKEITIYTSTVSFKTVETAEALSTLEDFTNIAEVLSVLSDRP